jgi:periplasmic divalent cation tolerance protein
MRKPLHSVIVVLVTVPSRSEAERLSRRLVAEGLAACANIIPGVTSIFRWKGKMERSREFLVLFKTRKRKYSALERSIKRLHSYEVPEIIALDIEFGNPGYLAWVREETHKM